MAGPRPGPGQPGYRPPTRTGPLPPPAAKKAGPSAIVYVLGGLVLMGAAAWLLLADPRPRLSADEANAAVREEMKLVQAAAVAIQGRTGRWPDSVAQVLDQLKAQGVDLETLNPPLRLLVNAPADDKLTIVLITRAQGFEVRATDAAGGSLAENGRDVVLTAPKPEAPDAEAAEE
jgi:hypothetical protein